ncbi:nuclear transport factor 2 family protein [Microcoleus sp. Pol11C3]|uniref:nuclear transport factor 2 family protein n=1 Tax=Microcoleus sp. Pol11C3 TaxID=3055390 RepID=UPI002FD01142
MTMTAETTKTQDEALIRQIIADTASAICAKDLDRIMAHYAQDVIIFDAKPPFQTKGADEFRRTWEACLPYFPDSFGIERRDLSLTVSGDLAIAHWLFHFTGMAPDHPAGQMWMRITSGCQRKQGRWQIVHEHCSVPFDPETSKAVFMIAP